MQRCLLGEASAMTGITGLSDIDLTKFNHHLQPFSFDIINIAMDVSEDEACDAILYIALNLLGSLFLRCFCTPTAIHTSVPEILLHFCCSIAFHGELSMGILWKAQSQISD